MTVEQKTLKEITQKSNEQFAEQKAGIETLESAIKNENLSNEVRRRKIEELREIMPGYNGMLDEEGRLVNHNSEEIREYLKLLQKQIELKATEEQRLDIAKKRNLAQVKSEEARNYMENYDYSALKHSFKNALGIPDPSAAKYVQMKDQKKDADAEMAQYDTLAAKLEKMTEARMNKIDAMTKQTEASGNSVKVSESLIDAKKKEIAEAKKMPETTLKEVEAKNKKIKALNDELYALQKLGVEESKVPKGTGSKNDDALKERQAADKALLNAMTKERDRQFQILEQERNDNLELLQEEETDRTMYALRTAKIEAQAAQARMDVMKGFGEQLQQVEFQNSQIRLDAVEENGKAVVSAESTMLKARIKSLTLEAPGAGGSGAPRTSAIRLKPGFADGGSNTSSTEVDGTYTNSVRFSDPIGRQLLDVLNRLADGDITVNYGITELKARQREKLTAKSGFTR